MFLNGGQIDNIVEVRNLLQVKAAELAANCVNNEYMSKLYEISHKSHKAYMEQNYKEFLEDDLEFHLCIAECSENQVIYSLMQTINNLMKRVSRTGMVNEEQLRNVYEEHQKIYGFILTHDAKGAKEAMEEHVRSSVERYDYRG